MSFAAHARKVREPGLTPWRRLSALRACVSHLCGLGRLPYRATLTGLGLDWQWGVPREPPTEAFLLATLARVERARNRYLEGHRALERRRIRAKLLRSARHPSAAERERVRVLRAELEHALAAG